ncbi:5908_t:CDS:2 [Dentiscutata heterogama]|uniref:5908_t:CDS:1 n=1 Tax=Dentiscutata heterogama TaxID=1316150 RepID=A0ACA9K8A5_9GLOM|nr:5908_t:CDS:2 [Dentiscutata heterogama]
MNISGKENTSQRISAVFPQQIFELVLTIQLEVGRLCDRTWL